MPSSVSSGGPGERLRADVRATGVVLLLCAAAGLVLAFAGSGPLVPRSGEFAASEADFANYRSWPHVEITGGGDWDRTLYAHLAPGATAPYPTGTIFVKELRNPRAPGGVDVDAMVKRGGSFGASPNDAPGWEWFGLQRQGNRVSIAWRGTRAPSGFGGYAGSSGVTCTGCHAAARAQDFVRGPVDTFGLALGR